MELDLGDVSHATVKFAGESFKVREPNVEDIENLNLKLSELKDDKQSIAVLKDFLDGLGFPKANLNKLTARKMNDLVDFLAGSKKN